jgi:flagellar biosynthesis/type III secretory pathway chaperone
MNTQQIITQLFSQLNELGRKLEQLAATLLQEQTALAQNAYAEIERLAQHKEALSGEIEQLEKQRQAACRQLNIGCDFASIQALLNRIAKPLAARLEQQWDTIIRLGGECASQNQVNGILVAHQQRHAQQALAILRGITGNSEVYSASGAQQQVVDQQHSLGRV